jgi:hypothetical protein
MLAASTAIVVNINLISQTIIPAFSIHKSLIVIGVFSNMLILFAGLYLQLYGCLSSLRKLVIPTFALATTFIVVIYFYRASFDMYKLSIAMLSVATAIVSLYHLILCSSFPDMKISIIEKAPALRILLLPLFLYVLHLIRFPGFFTIDDRVMPFVVTAAWILINRSFTVSYLSWRSPILCHSEG